MKRTILALVLSLSTFGSFANANLIPPNSDIVNQMALAETYLGGEVPFPFGKEIPFPWNAIEGMWQVEDEKINAFFSFQVMRDQSGTAVLKVIHIDPNNGKVLGQGAGFANETQKVVRALMKGTNSNYLVFVRVFRNLRINQRIEPQATVLSVRTFGNRMQAEKEWHFLLHKVNNRPYLVRQ